MPKSKSRKKKSPKRVLALPDLEHAKTAVLNSLTSASGQRTYDHAIREFVTWYCSEPRLAFNRTVVLRYRICLEQRGYAPATINLRLAAVRRVAYEAADAGLLSPELAAGIRRVKGVRRIGDRLGNWLTPEQGRRLLDCATPSTARELRDHAMIAIWFLAELESEAVKSRRVLEQVPPGKREWKPHERSMEFGYLSDLVANIPSWVGMAITLDELDVAPKEGPQHKPAPLNTSAELVAALDKAVAQAREALQKTTDAHLETSWRLLAGGRLALEQPRHDVIRDTFLHSAHHRGQMTVYLRLLGSTVPSVYGPTAADRSFG